MFVKKQTYQEQHFTDTETNLAVNKTQYKQTRACDCCGDWKRSSYFYNWTSDCNHLTGDWIMIVCSRCAKREAGSKLWRKLND
tara:strand:- start:687 stop:935 length:249 start_codon:yes stop_codon:yes gene_type:complete